MGRMTGTRRPRIGLTPAALAALGALAAGAVGVLPAQAQETATLAGERIGIHNLAGEVEVVRGSGSDVIVHVVRGGVDGDRLAVRTGEVGGRSTLRVVYPADRIVYSRGDWRGRVRTRVDRDGLLGRNGDRVQIASSGRGLDAHADLRIEIPPGRDVEVRLATGRMSASGVRGDLLLDNGSGSISVEDVEGRLLVDTGSGNVDVRGVRGTALIDTGSGNVSVADIRGDRVRIDTGSGSVRGGDLQAALVEVDTGSGRVDLTELLSADVRVDTGSGSVDLDLVADVDRLDVDTGSGAVRLRAAGELGAEFEAETGSGRIDVGFPLEVTSMRRDHVRGRIGDGDGRIRVETGSGGITLERRGG